MHTVPVLSDYYVYGVYGSLNGLSYEYSYADGALILDDDRLVRKFIRIFGINESTITILFAVRVQ
eukprot:scaffold84907_cov15-Prasinocladus_malaysianus.AAC.1